MLSEASLFLTLWGATNQLDNPNPAEVLAALRETPRAFSQVPFWFWNGPLDPEEFRRQLREMADKGVYGAMPHPRFGMDRRDYLEEPFWKAMAATLDEAEKLGMKIWLYDEYNWPSGGAGGRVTQGHPEFYPRGLDYRKFQEEGPKRATFPLPAPTESSMEVPEKIVGAFLRPLGEDNTRYQTWGALGPQSNSVRGDLPSGRWEVLIFFQALGRNPSPLDDGSNAMTDYLSGNSMDRFLELTHEAYSARFRRYFGKVVPAIFVDECSTTSPAPFPWTEDFATEFQKRRGSDLLASLPDLLEAQTTNSAASKASSETVEQQARLTRLAYWQTVTELFSQRWLGQYAAWCRRHDLKLTGHIYEEDLASYAHAPQLMDLLRPLDLPGIDALGPVCPPHNAKVMISLAELEDKAEALCESLGLAGGWNCTLGMLRGGYNQLGLLGISRFVPHAFYQTLENPRVESPPSFFYQNAYWKYYRAIADLSARWSYLNHLGKRAASYAVYYPMESLWADSAGGKGQNVLPWQHRATGNSQAAQTIRVFNELLDQLFARRWEAQVVDHRLLSRSQVTEGEGTQLQVGTAQFRVLIVPPLTAIGSGALTALDHFLQEGGKVLWLGRFPSVAWPVRPGEPQATLAHWFPQGIPQAPGVFSIGQGQLVFLPAQASAALSHLEQNQKPGVPLQGQLEPLRISHRRTDQFDFYLLYNESDQFISGEAKFASGAAGVIVDLDTGTACQGETGDFGIRLDLRPRQSLAVLMTMVEAKLPRWKMNRPAGEKRDLNRNWEIQLAGGALDGKWSHQLGETTVQLPLFRMKNRGFKKLPGWTEPGYDDHDWRLAVALRDQALSTEASPVLLRAFLPPGVRALATPLPVTGEYALWINGHEVEKRLGPAPLEGDRVDISSWTKGQSNLLALETISHAEVAGLRQPITLVCGPTPLEQLRSWQELGFGYYSGRVLYRREFHLDTLPHRLWLDLGKVEHYVEVYVNGQQAGLLLWPPYEMDITPWIQAGKNEITLVVANSIANRFSWDAWGTRTAAKEEPSGILGPAFLWVEP